MAQISTNRFQIFNKLMRRFNLSQRQLITLVVVIALAIVSAFVLVGLIVVGSSETFDRTHKQDSSVDGVVVTESSQEEKKTNASEKPEEHHAIKEASPRVMVHVDGAVKSPGLYVLQMANPRVNDAIQIAGGITEDANSRGINLASPVEDGQKIYIPQKGEETPSDIQQPHENKQTDNKQTNEKKIVDINRATVAELTNLKGVGEGLAERIVADRKKNGPFKTTEDLMRVSGIGQKKFNQFKDNIRV